MRILLVEDEKQIADFLKMSLEAECFAVDVVSDGEKGSFWARTNDYDLLILDNMLPGKTGKEICTDVRVAGKMIPILILSVCSDTNMKVELLNAGADDYLIKPFSLQELLARMRALLRRPLRVESKVLAVDNLTIDSEKHVVVRGDTKLRLTRKEFTLLEYLVKNAGVALSRGMIMEHVWDMNADPFSKTIESHILSLRRKVDTDGERKLIHTVPGLGYMVSDTE